MPETTQTTQHRIKLRAKLEMARKLIEEIKDDSFLIQNEDYSKLNIMSSDLEQIKNKVSYVNTQPLRGVLTFSLSVAETETWNCNCGRGYFINKAKEYARLRGYISVYMTDVTGNHLGTHLTTT